MSLDYLFEQVSGDTFRISSGDTPPANQRNRDVLLAWNAVKPFCFITLFLTAEQAVAVGEALIRHGKRIQEQEEITTTTEGVSNVRHFATTGD